MNHCCELQVANVKRVVGSCFLPNASWLIQWVVLAHHMDWHWYSAKLFRNTCAPPVPTSRKTIDSTESNER